MRNLNSTRAGLVGLAVLAVSAACAQEWEAPPNYDEPAGPRWEAPPSYDEPADPAWEAPPRYDAPAAQAPQAPCDYPCQIRTIINRGKDAAVYEGDGRAVVRFTVRKTGELVQVSVEPGAASPSIEQAAIAIVQNASRSFPPFPAGLDGEQRTFVLPIVFAVKERPAPAR